MDGMGRAEASCVDLMRERLREPAVVAMAAMSPSTGAFSWSAGASPDGRPVTTRSPMYAASITKQFIAALVGQVVLARRLQLDAGVRRIVPALPVWAEPVRVRHLLHHTAGLPSTAELLSALHLSDHAALDNGLVVRGLSQVPQPPEPPGRVFAYSNVGYVVVAEVVRAAAGADPAALVRRALLTPLGLTDSSIGQAPPYKLRHPPPRTVGDGGLWTTARDLLHWLEALNRGLLGDQLTDLLQTPGHLDDGTALDYAWGMTARPASIGITYTHGGSWPGWTAKAVRNPAAGTALALLTSLDDEHLVSDVAMEMHERLLVG
jgi:CubicO group peptidase (beta-lactamase class C family)